MINLDNLNFLDWDYPAIYEGVMSPENNFIMIIQNFWMTVTSSIGYVFLIPFFEVTEGNFLSTQRLIPYAAPSSAPGPPEETERLH